MKLHIGSNAPEFRLPDQEGVTHGLADYRGKWVVLYFYPKDDTPGCTTEACSMRDNLPHFEQVNAVVLGVSNDTVKSHKKFADKYNLPFTLLADENKKVVELYGVWGEKKMMGKSFMGISRTTFIINPEGSIATIYSKADPGKHVAEIINFLNNA